MRHRRPTTMSSRALALLRPLAALTLTVGLAGTVLASAGGASTRDPGLDVVQAARAQVGDAYLWGGTGPDAWDC